MASIDGKGYNEIESDEGKGTKGAILLTRTRFSIVTRRESRRKATNQRERRDRDEGGATRGVY